MARKPAKIKMNPKAPGVKLQRAVNRVAKKLAVLANMRHWPDQPEKNNYYLQHIGVFDMAAYYIVKGGYTIAKSKRKPFNV